MEQLKCRDCKERHVGCHGECEHYLAWREENEKLKKRMHEQAWYERLAKPQKKVRDKK